jgi:hypothetical protein
VSAGEACTWCGAEVAAGEGFRALEPAGARRAVFCRLEHVVPWAIRGAYWQPADAQLTPPEELTTCALCRERLGDAPVVLVRERGEARVSDGFCSVEHLLAWAKAGGRYGSG